MKVCNGCGTTKIYYSWHPYLFDGGPDCERPSNTCPYWCKECGDEHIKNQPSFKPKFKRLEIGDEEMKSDTMQWAKVDSCWDLAEMAVNSVPRVLLWGLPGTAKTTFGLNKNQKRYSITFSEDFTVQELLGHYVPKGNVFEWHDGPVLRAWREGCGLILNELGRASGPVLDVMLGVLDDPQMAELALPNGDKVRPAKGFKVVATSNSKPELMDPALVDRFDAIVQITEPHPELIRHLNAQVKGLGTAIKNSYLNPDKYISPRRALALVQMVNGEQKVPKRAAALLAFGDRAPDFIAASGAAA